MVGSIRSIVSKMESGPHGGFVVGSSHRLRCRVLTQTSRLGPRSGFVVGSSHRLRCRVLTQASLLGPHSDLAAGSPRRLRCWVLRGLRGSTSTTAHRKAVGAALRGGA